VGISRADEELIAIGLVKQVLATGTPREHLGYTDLRTLAAIDPVVQRVLGYTRYRIDGDPQNGATIHVLAKGGIAERMRSRAEVDPTLRGTKRQVAIERRIFVATGARDQRQMIIAPELRRGQVCGLTLLHVEFREHVPVPVLRLVLRGYRNRYDMLRNAITETEPEFKEDLLEQIPVAQLLTEPILALAQRWKKS
jgi:hypothetical protein